MSIIEVLQKIGVENLKFQVLDHDLISANQKNGQSKITFGSDARVDHYQLHQYGLIIWCDRDKIQPILESL